MANINVIKHILMRRALFLVLTLIRIVVLLLNDRIPIRAILAVFLGSHLLKRLQSRLLIVLQALLVRNVVIWGFLGVCGAGEPF